MCNDACDMQVPSASRQSWAHRLNTASLYHGRQPSIRAAPACCACGTLVGVGRQCIRRTKGGAPGRSTGRRHVVACVLTVRCDPPPVEGRMLTRLTDNVEGAVVAARECRGVDRCRGGGSDWPAAGVDAAANTGFHHAHTRRHRQAGSGNAAPTCTLALNPQQLQLEGGVSTQQQQATA